MSQKVWKFELKFDDYVEVDMPQDSIILQVGMQYGKLCCWALVRPENRMKKRRLRIAGTGHTITEKLVKVHESGAWQQALNHLGTVFVQREQSEAQLVFHVFEIIE